VKICPQNVKELSKGVPLKAPFKELKRNVAKDQKEVLPFRSQYSNKSRW